MSKMGRFVQEEQERERSRTASIYEAEIQSLVEEINKLKKRLETIESADMIIKNGKIFSDVTGKYGEDTTTVSRPKEVEEYVPWTGYVLVSEYGDSIDSSCSKKTLSKSPAFDNEGTRIVKVKEVYEANGDV